MAYENLPMLRLLVAQYQEEDADRLALVKLHELLNQRRLMAEATRVRCQEIDHRIQQLRGTLSYAEQVLREYVMMVIRRDAAVIFQTTAKRLFQLRDQGQKVRQTTNEMQEAIEQFISFQKRLACITTYVQAQKMYREIKKRLERLGQIITEAAAQYTEAVTKKARLDTLLRLFDRCAEAALHWKRLADSCLIAAETKQEALILYEEALRAQGRCPVCYTQFDEVKIRELLEGA